MKQNGGLENPENLTWQRTSETVSGFAVVYADRQLRSRRDVFLEAVRSSGSVLQPLGFRCATVIAEPTISICSDLLQVGSPRIPGGFADCLCCRSQQPFCRNVTSLMTVLLLHSSFSQSRTCP